MSRLFDDPDIRFGFKIGIWIAAVATAITAWILAMVAVAFVSPAGAGLIGFVGGIVILVAGTAAIVKWARWVDW